MTIEVVDDPTVSSISPNYQQLCQSATISDITVVASGGTGTSYSYQWYSNTTNSNSGGTLIPGATNSNYTPQNTTVNTTYYYCIITQTASGCEVTSPTVEVDIVPGPSFDTQPIGTSVCVGAIISPLSISYINGSGTPQYQWYSNTTSSSSGGTPITGSFVPAIGGPFSALTPSMWPQDLLSRIQQVIVSHNCNCNFPLKQKI